MRVRLISHGSFRGAVNMAVDEAIQMACQRGEVLPTLRFYQWTPACLTLGYFQDAQRDVDFDALGRMGVDMVRRVTGGKAVLHDDELTYSVIIPENDLPGSVLETYMKISAGLVEGLRKMGIPAEIAALEHGVTSRDPRFRQAACFSAPSWYEIIHQGKKLIGSAQSRKGGVILQHGSIPFVFDAGKVVSCLKTKSPEHRQRAVSLLEKKATGLVQTLGRPVDRQELQSCLVTGFYEALGWEFEEGDLTEKEKLDSERLRREKYEIASWNLERGRLNEDLY